jgi:hypothetical protein
MDDNEFLRRAVVMLANVARAQHKQIHTLILEVFILKALARSLSPESFDSFEPGVREEHEAFVASDELTNAVAYDELVRFVEGRGEGESIL